MTNKPTYEELSSQVQKLESELVLYKTIVDNVPISVFAKDVQDEYRYIIWNKELERVFGTKSNEIIGINDYQLFDKKEEADYFRQYDISVMTGKEIIDIPNEELTTAEGVKIVHTRKIPIYDENNQPKILLGCLEDITQKLATEQSLKESEKQLKELNADKDLFMSILAHDLRNPFNALLGFSDLLLRNFHKYDSQKIEQQLNIMNLTVRRTFELLEDLLIWSKTQLGKIPFNPQKLDLKGVCNELIATLKNHAESKGISVKFIESKPEIELMADLNMVKTILRNLVSNAIKFSNEKGQVNISAEIIDNLAIITVSDKGIGIDKKSLENLWKLSQPNSTSGTAEEKGSGLGLLICKGFVEKHESKIWVESEPGKGSDFKFTMPLFLEKIL